MNIPSRKPVFTIGLLAAWLYLSIVASVAQIRPAFITVPGTGPAQYTITDLGTLGGTTSEALAINNQGQVVGDATRAGEKGPYAFLWQQQPMQDLGSLTPYDPASYATAINNKSQIAGWAYNSSYDTNAFLYNNGKMTMLTRPSN